MERGSDYYHENIATDKYKPMRDKNGLKYNALIFRCGKCGVEGTSSEMETSMCQAHKGGKNGLRYLWRVPDLQKPNETNQRIFECAKGA